VVVVGGVLGKCAEIIVGKESLDFVVVVLSVYNYYCLALADLAIMALLLASFRLICFRICHYLLCVWHFGIYCCVAVSIS